MHSVRTHFNGKRFRKREHVSDIGFRYLMTTYVFNILNAAHITEMGAENQSETIKGTLPFVRKVKVVHHVKQTSVSSVYIVILAV